MNSRKNYSRDLTIPAQIGNFRPNKSIRTIPLSGDRPLEDNIVLTDFIQSALDSNWISVNSSSGADTAECVNNYDDLRSLQTGSIDVVQVKDFTYVGPDGSNYTTIGGTFRWTGNASVDNGGTIIAGWERDWDKVNARPEWWVCGGLDVNGDSYVNKNSDTRGIYDDTDRINSALLVTSNSKVYLQAKKEYQISGQIGTGIYDGNGATIKLRQKSLTPLTVSAGIGATSITVSDASSFRAGDTIVILDVSATEGGIAFGENNYGTSPISTFIFILDITGNTITLSSPLAQAMDIGDIVTAINPSMTTFSRNIHSGTHVGDTNYFLSGNDTILKDITFDEDRQTGESVDWRLSACVLTNSSAGNYYVDLSNVHFRNLRSAGLYGKRLQLRSFTAENCPTSIIHYSSADVGEGNNYMTIHDGFINNVGFLSHLSSHNEALFTFSDNTLNTHIYNISGVDIYNHVFGAVTLENHSKISLIDVNLKGAYPTGVTEKNLLTVNQPFGETAIEETVMRIDNCYFENCGDLVFSGRGAIDNPNINLNGAHFIDITNSSFINSRFEFYENSFINIDNCKLLHIDNYKSNFTTFVDYPKNYITGSSTLSRSSFLSFYNCDKVNVTNCHIQGEESYNYYADTGITVEHDRDFYLKESAVDTEQYYIQDINISNNTIKGVTRGIGVSSRWNDPIKNTYFNTPNLGFHINWKFNDNHIHLEKFAQYPDNATRIAWGISTAPGISVMRNEIIMPESPVDGIHYGIHIYGFDGADATRNKYRGSLVLENIVNTARSTDVAIHNNTTYHNIIANNYVEGVISGSANSSNVNNTTINTALFPDYTTPEHQKQKVWLQDNNDY